MKLSLTLTLTLLTCYSIAQTTTTAFLGIQLGQNEATFLKNYPNATSNSDHMNYVNSTIDHKNMVLHSIERTTSSGDPVSIDCYFRNKKLVVIEVEYMKFQYHNSLLKGLAAKYGMYSKSNVYSYTDPLNSQERTEVVIIWKKFKNSILEYDNVDELGHPHFTIADNKIQSDALEIAKKRDINKIE